MHTDKPAHPYPFISVYTRNIFQILITTQTASKGLDVRETGRVWLTTNPLREEANSNMQLTDIMCVLLKHVHGVHQWTKTEGKEYKYIQTHTQTTAGHLRKIKKKQSKDFDSWMESRVKQLKETFSRWISGMNLMFSNENAVPSLLPPACSLQGGLCQSSASIWPAHPRILLFQTKLTRRFHSSWINVNISKCVPSC